jgi:hypothetical protein
VVCVNATPDHLCWDPPQLFFDSLYTDSLSVACPHAKIQNLGESRSTLPSLPNATLNNRGSECLTLNRGSRVYPNFGAAVCALGGKNVYNVARDMSTTWHSSSLPWGRFRTTAGFQPAATEQKQQRQTNKRHDKHFNLWQERIYKCVGCFVFWGRAKDRLSVYRLSKNN